MTAAGSKEQDYFARAFELAYCIHVNKEVAFFVAEDALDGLDSMLGHHEKNRTPAERLRGFLKSGERTRPIRKTIRLNELQMLQWLVYKESEAWERLTERGEGFYVPTEEDLIVRYVKHLIFISLRRGSFSVTLAVGALLHQFDRRETRLFHDILTQSDSARLKDTNYIGKQRLEMLERVSRRFSGMIQIAGKPGDEKQFVMRPPAPWVTDLVNETLRRFTPWETSCVVAPGFDVIDISGLYFSETSAHDEELIELNRIHTVLDPVCFATFAEGVSRYVRMLPNEDKDKSCRFDSLNEPLRVPQFSNHSGPSRGDRFQSPELTKEDYVRLQRTLDARGQRRRVFTPQLLHVYVDEMLAHSFILKEEKRGSLQIDAEAGVIEVRGKDTEGELTLATLILGDDQLGGKAFEDSVVHSGGQKITVKLTPVRSADGASKRRLLEVSYDQPGSERVSQLARRAWLGLTWLRSGQSAWLKAGLVLSLITVAVLFTWWQLRDTGTERERRPSQETAQNGTSEVVVKESGAPVTPSPIPKQSPPVKEVNQLVAQARWNLNREAALRAVSLERTRDETAMIDLSPSGASVLLSVPRYDEQGDAYSRYRVVLSTAAASLWQQTLRSPKVTVPGYTHIMDVMLVVRLREPGPYELEVEGSVKGSWRSLGRVKLSMKDR